VPAIVAAGPDDQKTEDILYMVDGRELHGQILSENTREVVFELVDAALGLRSKMRFPFSAIARIDRDVPVEADPVADVKRSSGPATEPAEEKTGRYGRARPDNNDLDLPTIYLVPMRGQMGTDIHRSIYEKVVEDIKLVKPDVVVYELNSKDFPDLMIPQVERGVPRAREHVAGRACRHPAGHVGQGLRRLQLHDRPVLGRAVHDAGSQARGPAQRHRRHRRRQVVR
jgi:hypothetical protein